MNAGQSQTDYLREYTPDVVAALTNLGQASAYYDANGHYTRTQPYFGAFGLNASNELTTQSPDDRYIGSVRRPRALSRRRDAGDARRIRARSGARMQRLIEPGRMRRGSLHRCGGGRCRGRRGAAGRGGAVRQQRCSELSGAGDLRQRRVRGRRRGGPHRRCTRRLDRVAVGHGSEPGGGDADDRQRGIHAVPHRRDLRDPAAVADRRALRRLSAGNLRLPGAAADHAGAGRGHVPAARSRQTSSPIDPDIVQNISQEPIRQRLSIILNELGTGLAARGADLAAVIRRANPALG